MPTYEYACTACANQWEEIQKISADPIDTCPKCGQKTAKRQISGGNFILKGGGWYADLYSSSSNKGGGGKSASESKSESKSESTTTSTPAKSESTAPAAAPAPSTGGSSTPSKT
jgi:putative FmdB family regulatory protein